MHLISFHDLWKSSPLGSWSLFQKTSRQRLFFKSKVTDSPNELSINKFFQKVPLNILDGEFDLHTYIYIYMYKVTIYI